MPSLNQIQGKTNVSEGMIKQKGSSWTINGSAEPDGGKVQIKRTSPTEFTIVSWPDQATKDHIQGKQKVAIT